MIKYAIVNQIAQCVKNKHSIENGLKYKLANEIQMFVSKNITLAALTDLDSVANDSCNY